MSRLILFLDLDDTILQTAPKCPPGEPLIPAAVDRAGRALSFMSQGQQRLFDWWAEQATIIPVTGRTDDALARVLMPFTSWRITHHGAVIRQPDGQLPPWWHEEIAPRLSAAQPLLQQLAEQLGVDAVAGGYRVSQHRIEQQLTYLSIKADGDGDALACVRKRLEAEGLPPTVALHHNGNNLALMVRAAQKHHAVQRVIQELAKDGPVLSIGAGDSLTDLPFLRLCDFALVPKDSQIQRETWGAYQP